MNVLELNKALGTDAALTVYEFCALSDGQPLTAMRLYRARRNVGLTEAREAINKVLRAAGWNSDANLNVDAFVSARIDMEEDGDHQCKHGNASEFCEVCNPELGSGEFFDLKNL